MDRADPLTIDFVIVQGRCENESGATTTELNIGFGFFA